MKHVFLCLFSSVLLACNVTDSKDQTDGKEAAAGGNTVTANTNTTATADATASTTIQWLDPVEQKLGNLEKGQVAEITWKFKNTGDKPLLITNVSAACGCTTPDVPKEPIAPGAESKITAKFNSQNFSGHVTKEVYVDANNSNRNNGNNNKLSFTADIK